MSSAPSGQLTIQHFLVPGLLGAALRQKGFGEIEVAPSDLLFGTLVRDIEGLAEQGFAVVLSRN